MSKPLALDLFCKAGGATKGLQLAGFEVVGVDIEPQPRYCGDHFIQADVLGLSIDLTKFDFIWASPPCQHYSCVTPTDRRDDHPDLIAVIRQKLRGTGTPYAIENVAGARKHLIDPVKLCGSMFGLKTFRHRFFETSFTLPLTPECNHDFLPLLVTTAGANSRRIRGPGAKSTKNAVPAYGIDWMIGKELAEAIPPAYAQFIGQAALAHIRDRRLAA